MKTPSSVPEALIPIAVMGGIPPLLSTNDLPAASVTVHARLVDPARGLTLYVFEMDPDHGQFSALAVERVACFRSQFLHEIERANNAGVSALSFDAGFAPVSLADVLRAELTERAI